jgi:hypothetical protein
MGGNKDLVKKSENGNEKLHISDVICRYIKHIWWKKGIKRKCIICGKEQINIVNVVNMTGKLHGGNFKLRDNWKDV